MSRHVHCKEAALTSTRSLRLDRRPVDRNSGTVGRLPAPRG